MSFFEISPVGFTRRSRVYRRDAIRFQGLDAILGGWMDWLCDTDSLDRMYYEISPVGFTRRSRVYPRDAIRFQGFVEIERTSLIFRFS